MANATYLLKLFVNIVDIPVLKEQYGLLKWQIPVGAKNLTFLKNAFYVLQNSDMGPAQALQYFFIHNFKPMNKYEVTNNDWQIYFYVILIVQSHPNIRGSMFKIPYSSF